jgi:signal transduction histidine kinase
VSFFGSLQGKLIVASVAIVIIVLALAGAAFVYVTRDDQRQQELDRVSASSTAIQSQFLLRQLQGDSEEKLVQFVCLASRDYDVRILMIDTTQSVVADSCGRELEGKQLELRYGIIQDTSSAGSISAYVTVRPIAGSPGSDLVLVAPTRSASLGTSSYIYLTPFRYTLVLAVPEDTLANAWLDLLPGLGIAAAIALPVAILLAIILAGYITRPLEELTEASRQMAAGRFDVAVSVGREDEVGRLAQAFTTMAARVGEAHRQMRTLVANVSHDMKTPLTSILGFSQALRDGEAADGEAGRMATIIHEEAQRLNRRLSDLLYLSELESGQVVMQLEEVDLGDLLRREIVNMEPDVTRRRIVLQADLPDSAVALTDGQKLERAIENLLDNARKFTPEGGRIEVRGGRDSSGQVWAEVGNTANGLEADELPLLFERFYRRDRSRNDNGNRGSQAGSGLGLPIAKDLVELLGGRLSASLRDGEVVFRVELPQPA